MRSIVLWSLVLTPLGPVAPAGAADPDALAATLTTAARFVQIGQPIWVDFTITNTSDQPAELVVPGTSPLPTDGTTGLPLTHVFSGKGFAGLSIQGLSGQYWNVAQGYHPPGEARTLVLDPHASVGVGLDVTQYYRVLRNPGHFTLQWSPYGGAISSNELIIEVDTPKQAVIQTDQGVMTVRFFYEDAPNHVANFMGLARQGFYDNLTFHRILPGYCIQGGCPNGDGTGVKPDGGRLQAELSDRPIERGTIWMARLEEDLNSASCQYLIANAPIPQWDGRYTVFGEVVGAESLATLDKLMATPLGANGTPQKRIYTRSVRIVDVPSDPTDRTR